eukprot:g8733.t1
MSTFDPGEYEGWDAIPSWIQQRIRQDHDAREAAEAELLLLQQERTRESEEREAAAARHAQDEAARAQDTSGEAATAQHEQDDSARTHDTPSRHGADMRTSSSAPDARDGTRLTSGDNEEDLTSRALSRLVLGNASVTGTFVFSFKAWDGKMLASEDEQTKCLARAPPRLDLPDFSVIPGLDPRGDGLWLESVRYIAACYNLCGTKANPGNISPHEAFTGEKPDAIVVPFFQPVVLRVVRAPKLDDQSEGGYFLGQSYQHGRSTARLLKRSTGRVCHSRDFVFVSGAAASAGEGGAVDVPAMQQLPAPASPLPTPSPLGPSPLPPTSTTAPPPRPPPQPRLSGTERPVAPPLTSESPSPPQPLARLHGDAGPLTSLPLEETALPRPAGVLPPLSRRAITELRPGRTGGMDDVRMASRTRSGGKQGGGDAERHSRGLLSLAGGDVLRSVLHSMDVANTQSGAASSVRGKQRATVSPMMAGGAAVADGIPCGLVARFARREDIDIAIMNQRPPHDRPELPLCRGIDLRVPKTFAEATSFSYEHRNLFIDAMRREFHGLLSAGTFTVAN